MTPVNKQFNATKEELPDILEWVETKTSELLPLSLAMKLQLAAEEAIVNVINYAYNDAADRPIILSFNKNKDCIYLEIADKGIPFNPLKNINVDRCAPLEKRVPGGWGREFIVKMTSAVKYEYRNNTNILRLEINPADFAELSV